MQHGREYDTESIGHLGRHGGFGCLHAIGVDESVGPQARSESNRFLPQVMRVSVPALACITLLMLFSPMMDAQYQVAHTPGASQRIETPMNAVNAVNSACADAGVYVRPDNPFPRIGPSVVDAVTKLVAGLQAIERDGGFLRIPDGATLKLGDHSPQIETLRARLDQEARARSKPKPEPEPEPGPHSESDRDSGRYPGTHRPSDVCSAELEVRRGLRLQAQPPPNASSFDPALERAIRRFQYLYGIEVDGIVGPQTRAELNRPIAQRIHSLERFLARQGAPVNSRVQEAGGTTKHSPENVPPAKIQVNIPAFEVVLIREGSVVFHSRVVVGRKSRPTPRFSAQLTHVVINPSWTVPPTILRRDILPALQKNPGYLAEKGLMLLDRAGVQIDPAGVDFARYTAATFPYVVRQPPCAQNVLGKVKFIFPNPHSVYMHDTNHPELFEQDIRAFSSGCIRVARPLELAMAILAVSESPDNREDTQPIGQTGLMRRIQSGNTEWIALGRPILVEIIYEPMVVDAEGAVRLLPDIYGLLR